jgi:hypothetical protein
LYGKQVYASFSFVLLEIFMEKENKGNIHDPCFVAAGGGAISSYSSSASGSAFPSVPPTKSHK